MNRCQVEVEVEVDSGILYPSLSTSTWLIAYDTEGGRSSSSPFKQQEATFPIVVVIVVVMELMLRAGCLILGALKREWAVFWTNWSDDRLHWRQICGKTAPIGSIDVKLMKNCSYRFDRRQIYHVTLFAIHSFFYKELVYKKLGLQRCKIKKL